MLQPAINDTSNIIIDSEIDYLYEAYSLLVRLGSGTRYADTHKELLQKYPGSLISASHKFTVLEDIESDVLKFLSKEKEYQKTLDYYFQANSDNSECIAELALLYIDFDAFHPTTIDELSNHLFQLDRSAYQLTFGKILQGYNNSVKDDSEYLPMDDPMEIIRYAMQLDVSDTEKLKMVEIFSNPKPHQEKILSLMKEIIHILQKHSSSLKKLVNEFACYWSQKTSSITPSALIQESLGIHFAENELGTIIHPQIINLNHLRIHADVGDDSLDEYKVGILFDDNFLLKTAGENTSDNYQDYALRNLKTLSDKSKFDILCFIKDKPAYGSERAKQLGLTTATISHHMSALLSAGLVKMEKENNRIYYSSNQENIEKLLTYCKEKLI